MQVFPTAPMSPLIRGLTILLLGLPVLFFAVALMAEGPPRVVMGGTGGFLVLLYAGVWLYARPASYRVTPAELEIVWPTRSQPIQRHEVVSARVMDRNALRDAYGYPLRIGVGGLFGTFGWLWSRRAGRIDIYVTNLGPWVVVERRAGRPLVLSPDDPHAFVRALDG